MIARLKRLRQMGARKMARRVYEEFAFCVVTVLTAPLRRNTSNDPYHRLFAEFLRLANEKSGHSILELGSRYRVAEYSFTGYAEHVGLDINEGPNVDVVGDIHALSSVFDRKFDVVYSVSVFEHLAMPWKAVTEISKVMNEGGLLYISTHPCWPAHALPWDFYRYQQESFKALLNKHTGFEIISCVEGLPARIVPLVKDESTRRLVHEPVNLGVAVLARKICDPDVSLNWEMLIDEVLATSYPKDGHSYL